MSSPTPGEVIEFWRQAGPARWFAKDAAFDAEIGARFEGWHHAAARGELGHWTEDWQGSLALLLLLDQFPRNIYRANAHAFACDPLARGIARAALDAGHDQSAPAELRVFFYLPFEHSELIEDQDRCVELCERLDLQGSEWAKWARLHRDVIVRFGRFPHRNTALGRVSTPEEQAFLESGGFNG